MQMLGPHLALLARRMTATSPPATSTSGGPPSRPTTDAGHLRIVVNR